MTTEKSFFQIFKSLEDPRDNRGKVYPLINIIILALYGVLIGYEDFSNMSYYLKKSEDELKRELGLEVGVPSHDVFSAVFRVLDINRFMELFVEWTKSIVSEKTGKHIAIDGKAVRAATKKAENGIHMDCTNDELVGIGIGVADGSISYEKLLEWVRSHSYT